MVDKQPEYMELLKLVTLVNILKTSLLLFVITLQIVAIVWIVQQLGTEEAPPAVTTTITETETTTTPTP